MKFSKYLIIGIILIGGLYYTKKMSEKVINKSSLVGVINENSRDYNVSAVSATIDDEYIIPGLNGYAVNVLKSYNNMRHLDTFNSYYLEYDKVIPDISLENNKNKIIKYGNKRKKSVSLIMQDNLDLINYAKEKHIKINRLVNHDTFDIDEDYEQINNDYEEYKKVELMLDNSNKNKNICYISDDIKDICKNNNKYLVMASISLNNYNLSRIKDNIESGYIIYIGDNVSLTDFKILVRQIYYQDLDIIYLSELINEERERKSD